jgi:hypothetical protein
VRKDLVETPDALFLGLYFASQGESIVLPKFNEPCVIIVGFGSVKLTEDRADPWEVDAPSHVLFSPGRLACEATTRTLALYCLFNKNTATDLADVRAFAAQAGAGTVPSPIGF